MRILHRLTFANVVSCLALFIALGGTGYAAFKLPRNSVGARELRPNAVGYSELADDAVRGDNVRDGSLDLRDLSSGARRTLAGERGATGPQGVPGPAGVSGANGAPGKDAVSLWARVSIGGTRFGGNATAVDHVGGTGQYRVIFATSVAECSSVATLAKVGTDPGDPEAGRITVVPDGDDIRVNTFGLNGNALDLGFHLIVVC
jgi:hypothetical protein